MSIDPVRRSLLLLPLALASPARAEAFPLAALMTQLAAITARRARYREERRLAVLTRTLESRGVLIYRRPDYLEMDKQWPVAERTVIDGTRLIVTDPASNDPPHVVDFAGRPELATTFEAMRAPLAGDLEALRRVFDIEADGTLADWRMTLRPREARAAKLLRSARLAGQGTWIGTLGFVQANGDESSLQIDPA